MGLRFTILWFLPGIIKCCQTYTWKKSVSKSSIKFFRTWAQWNYKIIVFQNLLTADLENSTIVKISSFNTFQFFLKKSPTLFHVLYKSHNLQLWYLSQKIFALFKLTKGNFLHCDFKEWYHTIMSNKKEKFYSAINLCKPFGLYVVKSKIGGNHTSNSNKIKNLALIG